MSATIVQFTGAERVEIWSGRTREHPDRLTYFLDYVEPDGSRCNVHEAASWQETTEAARYWQAHHGLRIVDKTGGAA